MKYNPKEYWTERKNPNKYNDLQKWDIEILKPLVDSASNIFEYGVGTGRLMPLYSDKEVLGYDFVTTYKDRCIENAQKNGVDFTWTDEIEYYGPFDVGVLSKVLLHHLDPKWVIGFMSDICDVVFISTGINGTADHCINHDYRLLFEHYNVLEWKLEENDLTIVYENK